MPGVRLRLKMKSWGFHHKTFLNYSLFEIISKKICLLFVFQLSSSKFYINLNMKLGGLGPDYETIKEKVSDPKVSLGRGEWQRNQNL